MGLQPINVELTDFQKLEFLRDEEERLSEELSGVEKDIRGVLLAAARREYLMTLSPYYAAQGGEGTAPAQVGELESRRQLVSGALEVVAAQRTQYEQALGAAPRGRGARSKDAGAGQGSRFESFEDFRQSKD